MDFANFWLPIIGGVALGGIAVNAWFSGDKIVALWFGFLGIVCFLLLVTLQIQDSILRARAAASAQPEQLPRATVLEQRPWIKLDVEITGDLNFSTQGRVGPPHFHIPIRYRIEATGKTPAKDTAFGAHLIPSIEMHWPKGSIMNDAPQGMPDPGTDVEAEINRLCEFQENFNVMGQTFIGAITMSNGDIKEQIFGLSGNPRIFDAAKSSSGYWGQFLIVACVTYRSTFSDDKYRTVKVYRLFKGVGDLKFNLDGETVSRLQLGFVPNPLNSGYAT